MNLSRRRFIASTSLLTLAPAWTAFAGASGKEETSLAKDAEFETAFDTMRQMILDYHQTLGYQSMPHKSLITGHAFNEGLRYDDSGTLANMLNGEMIVQDCARIEDITLRGHHDVLPYFHIFSCNRRADTERRQTIGEIVDFLITAAGLAPEQIGLVSISALQDYRDLLTKRGIDWERQVFIRDTEEAKAAGDGSGYFRPKNHPEQPEEITAGLYVWLGEGQAPALDSYPLPAQWTEIAEVALDPDSALAYGLGLERLVYAKTGLKPSWHDRRGHLLAQVETEAAETGAPLPQGYYLFKDS